jgi:hypothetical protein
MDEPKAIEYRFARYSVDLDHLRRMDEWMREADTKTWDDITDAELHGAVDALDEVLDGV